MNNPILYVDPDGNVVEMCCEELQAALKGVGSTVWGEVTGAYEFLTNDIFDSNTYKGAGNLALGAIVTSGGAHMENADLIDRDFGTNTRGVLNAVGVGLDQNKEALLNGNTEQRAAAITSILLIFTPGKLDDLGKLSKLTKFSDALQTAGKALDFKIVDGAIDLGKNNSAGWYDFVLTDSGDLRLGSGHHKLANDGADDLVGAGQVYVDKNGKINAVNNNSGHYQPTKEQGVQAAQVLKNAGLTTDDLQFINYN